MKQTSYFMLAAFIVAAALWKAGVPLLPICAGIACAALLKLLSPKRA